MYPSLTYPNTGAALTWLKEAFGFEGHRLAEIGVVVRFGGRTT